MTHPTLLQMAEACETAADAERIAASDLGVEELPLAGALRSAAALLRTLATSDVEGVAERLDQIAGPESSIARTAALLLRASAAREAAGVERLMHGLYHIREMECAEDHDESEAPCPRRTAKEAIDNRPCSICARARRNGGG